MAQITLRVSDDLLEQIEQAAGPETSRSEWLRDAARMRLEGEHSPGTETRLEDLEQRVEDLEAELDRPLWGRLFDRP